MPDFTYDIGYYGYVQIGQNNLLCTNGSISLSQNQIYTNGIWGAGWYNGVKNVTFAPDYPVLGLQVGFELTSSNNLIATLGQFASTKRNESKEITVYPNGIAGYKGKAYCQSISFQTQQDSLVTANIGAKSAWFEPDWFQKGAGQPQPYHEKYVQDMATGYKSVFPYYGTTIQLSEDRYDISGTTSVSLTMKNLISWSIQQTTDIVFAKCCDVQNFPNSLEDLHADYAAIGLATADGSFSKFGMQQFQNSEQFRYYIKGESKIKMKSIDNIQASIAMQGISLSQQSTSTQNGSSLIQCDFNFTVIGDGKNPALLIQQN